MCLWGKLRELVSPLWDFSGSALGDGEPRSLLSLDGSNFPLKGLCAAAPLWPAPGSACVTCLVLCEIH